MENDIPEKNKRKSENLENLDKIKKSKTDFSSYDSNNMGKVPSSKDKLNVIELDIAELSDILVNNKRPLRSRTTLNKIKPDDKSDNKKSKTSDKGKMIKKCGGYFDENEEFIVEDDGERKVEEVQAPIEEESKPSKAKKQTNKITAKTLKELDLTSEEYKNMTENELKYWKKINKEQRLHLKKLEKELEKYDVDDIPEKYKILQFPVNLPIKRNIMNKLMQIEMMEPSDPEYFKLSKWLDGVMKIPFGNYVELPVNKNDPSEKIYEFINKVQIDMENSTYGHKDAKNKIMQIVCQWISNPKSSGNVIAIQGPPGIGKTSLVKNGISKALDRPFHMIALGGATDSTFLEGHSYTYEGSNWGRIVNILMDSKIMNPVIFFDELDKVSSTKQGEEIIGVLTHLTDQTQNSNFNDKYFSGIDLDLSKCLFVFSYNDESLINPILKDRLVKINLHGFSIDEKLAIAKDYLLKELSNNIGISTSEIIFSDEILKEIITKHTSEDGVRDLRRCLETILLKLNMVKYTNKLDKSLSNVNFPVNLTSSIVSDLLKKSEDNSHYQQNKHHHSIYL